MGPCVWLSMVAEAKRSSVPGVLIVTSMEALQDRLGFIQDELPFTLDEFLETTGRLKQTSRRRVGRVLHVTLTHYPTWQQDWKRDSDRDRQNRRRNQQTDRDTERDSPVTQGVTEKRLSSSSSSISKEDLDLDLNLGQNGARTNSPPNGRSNASDLRRNRRMAIRATKPRSKTSSPRAPHPRGRGTTRASDGDRAA
jgi:hypothetical protein